MFFAYRSLPKRTTLPTGSNLSVVGVKLDQYRDSVDLHKLQAAGISFVYLRATQGKSYFDDEYDRYRSQIQGTNLAFGSVLYFSDESTVKAQYLSLIHISEPTRPLYISYAVFCLKKKTTE